MGQKCVILEMKSMEGGTKMECENCHEKEAFVHLEGYGDLCMDCYNDLIAKMYGTERFEDFSKEISIYDTNGVIHHFLIWNMLIPPYSCWHANEADGAYSFEVMVGIDDEQLPAVQHLHQKILKGIGYKSLKESSNVTDTWIGNKQYGLKAVGTVQVAWMSNKNEPVFAIDGFPVTMDQWANMVAAYEGFVMDYQFRDKSDEVLEKNMILRQFCIQPEVIEARFEKTLGWFLEKGEYLDADRAEDCMEALEERVDELDLMYKYGEVQEAMELGSRVIARLGRITCSNEDFPEYIIEQIQQVLEIL